MERAEPLPRLLPRAVVRRPGPRRPWGAIALFIGPTLALYLAVVIYPIVRRQSEELALGYVTAQVFECMFLQV